MLAEFHWILYIFGALLVLTGIKMCLIDVYKIPVSVSLGVVVVVGTHLEVTCRKWTTTPKNITLSLSECVMIPCLAFSLPLK